MKNLKAKLNKQGGFTLIEMLIVVAIIAILVAVSIPLVNSALERAREATDAANERSFKALLVISYTNGKYELATGGTKDFTVSTKTTKKAYLYDAANGTLAENFGTTASPVKPYGKSTGAMGVDGVARKGCYLYGMVDDTGKVTMGWLKKGSSTTIPTTFTNALALISPLMVAEA